MNIQEIIANITTAKNTEYNLLGINKTEDEIKTEVISTIKKQVKNSPDSQIAIAWSSYEEELEAEALQAIEQIKNHLWSAYQELDADLDGHKIVVTSEGATIEKKKRGGGNRRKGPRALFKLDEQVTTVPDVVIAYLEAIGEPKTSKKIEYVRSTLLQKDENGKVIKRQNFKNLDEWLSFTGCTSIEQWMTRLGSRLQENK